MKSRNKQKNKDKISNNIKTILSKNTKILSVTCSNSIELNSKQNIDIIKIKYNKWQHK